MSKTSLIKSLLKILIFILLLVTILFFNISDLSNGNSIDINLENASLSTISNLKIYEKSNRYTLIKDVPRLDASQTLSTNINLSKKFTKGSIVLSYTSESHGDKELVLIENIEKGSFHKVNIKINGIDKNGILILDKDYQNII